MSADLIPFYQQIFESLVDDEDRFLIPNWDKIEIQKWWNDSDDSIFGTLMAHCGLTNAPVSCRIPSRANQAICDLRDYMAGRDAGWVSMTFVVEPTGKFAVDYTYPDKGTEYLEHLCGQISGDFQELTSLVASDGCLARLEALWSESEDSVEVKCFVFAQDGSIHEVPPLQ